MELKNILKNYWSPSYPLGVLNYFPTHFGVLNYFPNHFLSGTISGNASSERLLIN